MEILFQLKIAEIPATRLTKYKKNDMIVLWKIVEKLIVKLQKI